MLWAFGNCAKNISLVSGCFGPELAFAFKISKLMNKEALAELNGLSEDGGRGNLQKISAPLPFIKDPPESKYAIKVTSTGLNHTGNS
jgi:hypothetical protein